MSKRCPDCGFLNEDSRIYCSSCGELLDAELRLIQNLEKQKNAPSKSQPARTEASQAQTAPKRRNDDDDDYVPRKMAQEKKSSPAPWIILGVVVAAVIIWLMVH